MCVQASFDCVNRHNLSVFAGLFYVRMSFVCMYSSFKYIYRTLLSLCLGLF